MYKCLSPFILYIFIVFLKYIKLYSFLKLNLWNLVYHHGHQYFLSLLVLRGQKTEVVWTVAIFTHIPLSVLSAEHLGICWWVCKFWMMMQTSKDGNYWFYLLGCLQINGVFLFLGTWLTHVVISTSLLQTSSLADFHIPVLPLSPSLKS